jgi:hypothetical protein
MAFVMAKQRGWTKPLQFTVCNDFATMRAKVSTLVCCCVQRETVHRRLLKIRFASLCNSCAQVNSGECQALMWERFITKPCVLCVHTIDLWPRYPSQVAAGRCVQVRGHRRAQDGRRCSDAMALLHRQDPTGPLSPYPVISSY